MNANQTLPVAEDHVGGKAAMAAMAAMAAAKENFLSRWPFGTQVFEPSGQRQNLLAWLNQQAGLFVDQPILLSAAER